MNKNIDYTWLEKWLSVRFLFINSEIVCMPGCSRNNWTQFWPQGTHMAPQWYTDKVAYSLANWPSATRSIEAEIWAEDDQRILYREDTLKWIRLKREGGGGMEDEWRKRRDIGFKDMKWAWAKVCILGGNDKASWLEWKACIGQWWKIHQRKTNFWWAGWSVNLKAKAFQLMLKQGNK